MVLVNRADSDFNANAAAKHLWSPIGGPPADPSVAEQVKLLLKEGCDIRSIGRIAGVSATTVLRKIKSLAGAVREPVIGEGQVFEMDELCTFVGSKSAPVWVVYAIDKHSKAVIRYNVGNRSLGVLGAVTLPLLCSQPQKIYTDKLVQYRSLIPGSLHSMRANGTNHI